MAKASVLLSDYLKTDYVKAHGPLALTITGAEQVEFANKDSGKVEKKWALSVDEDERKVLLNKQNCMTLIDQLGDETDDWTGYQVELFFDPSVMFGGKKVGGVRLKVLATAA